MLADRAALPDPAALLALADQCVKCGYCLPHCPTFRAARAEPDSPRGRIALIQGWLGGALPLSAALERHLDGCLACRACEPVCPSLVRYGALIDGARALIVASRAAPRRRLLGLALDRLADVRRLPLLVRLAAPARWLAGSRLLAWFSGRSPRLAVLARIATALRPPRALPAGLAGLMVPAASMPRASDHADAASAPVATTPTPQFALFRGCIARASEPGLDAAALRVFAAVGLPVAVPDGQGCCGAMHRHNGLPAAADRYLAVNVAAGAGQMLIGTASACVAELVEHGGLDAREVCRVLIDIPWPATLALCPLTATIAVHEPCSHRNQLRDTAAVYQLLARIPGARVVPLPGNESCCGAAGTYLIAQAAASASLGADKLSALRALAPDLLVTTNTGCALQLRTLITAAGLAIPVLHPVELIDRQLPAAGAAV